MRTHSISYIYICTLKIWLMCGQLHGMLLFVHFLNFQPSHGSSGKHLPCVWNWLQSASPIHSDLPRVLEHFGPSWHWASALRHIPVHQPVCHRGQERLCHSVEIKAPHTGTRGSAVLHLHLQWHSYFYLLSRYQVKGHQKLHKVQSSVEWDPLFPNTTETNHQRWLGLYLWEIYEICPTWVRSDWCEQGWGPNMNRLVAMLTVLSTCVQCCLKHGCYM